MKKVLFLLIVSSVLISCGSQNNTLSQFSKRKYLKKYKPSKRVKDDPINTYTFEQEEAHEAIYAAKEIQPEHFVVNEIEAEGLSELILPQAQQIIPLKRKGMQHFSKPKSKFIIDNDKLVPLKRKLHPWSIVSIALQGILILDFITFLIIDTTSVVIAFSLTNVLLVCFGALLIGFVTGIISLNKIKKNPEKYWGKGWSIVSVILGILTLMFMSLVLVAFLNMDGS